MTYEHEVAPQGGRGRRRRHGERTLRNILSLRKVEHTVDLALRVVWQRLSALDFFSVPPFLPLFLALSPSLIDDEHSQCAAGDSDRGRSDSLRHNWIICQLKFPR